MSECNLFLGTSNVETDEMKFFFRKIRRIKWELYAKEEAGDNLEAEEVSRNERLSISERKR